MSIQTRTVAVNPAFLQEIKDDNRDLRSLFTHAIAAMDPDRLERVDTRHVAELLARLRDQLAMHFTLEEAYGYFDDPINTAPRLLERAEVLRSEHTSLFLELCRMVEEAEGLADHPRSFEIFKRLSIQFQSFHVRFQKHEACENELIFEALDDDIGVGD